MFDNFVKKTSWNFFRYAKKFQDHTSHIDQEDLMQVGLIGLMKAYEKYDYNYKTTKEVDKDNNEDNAIGFSHYMKMIVEGEIHRHVRDTLKIRRKDGGVANIFIDSLSKPIGDLSSSDRDITLEEAIVDESSLNGFESIENMLEIKEYINVLSDRQRKIILGRYFYNKTQSEVGAILGLSQVQVSRLEKKSLVLMRQLAHSREKVVEVSKKNTIKNKKGINTMQKLKTLDVAHALNYFESRKDEGITLDVVMEEYVEKQNIPLSELNYLLHTNCSDSFGKIIDYYEKHNTVEDEILHDPRKTLNLKAEVKEVKEMKVIKTTDRNTGFKKQPAKPQRTEKVETVPNVKHVEESKMIEHYTNPLSNVNILSLRVQLDSFEAAVSSNGVELINLPQEVELSIVELEDLKKDIEKIIEIKKSLTIKGMI